MNKMNRTVILASVCGENKSYFAIMDANSITIDNIQSVRVKFAESAGKYFHVDKQYCNADIFPMCHVATAAIIEANNRADGYFKDMDKKCFEFLMDAVNSVEKDELNKEIYNMLGELANMI